MSSDRSYNWKRTHEQYIPGEIERQVDALGLSSDVAALGESIHQEAIEADFQYRDADALASACALAAARMQGSGVTIEELEEVSREEWKLIQGVYSSLNQALGLSIQPNDAEPYVKRFGRKLGFDSASIEHCIRLVDEAKTEGFQNEMASKTLAASIAYIVSLSDGYNHTQEDIQDVTGVGTSTIRNHWKNVAEALEVHVPSRKGMDFGRGEEEPETLDEAWERLDVRFNPPDGLRAKTEELVEEYGDLGRKSPAGIIAGAFWVVTHDMQEDERDDWYIVGMIELAHGFGVSSSTISKRAKEIRTQL